MFSTIKLYIIGIGTAIVGVLYAIVKYQSSKIETLEEKVEVAHKEKVIGNIIEKAQIDAEKVEEIKTANIKDKNWRDNI